MSRSVKQAAFIVIAAAMVFGGIYLVSRPKDSAAPATGQTAPDAAVQQQIKDLEGKVRNNPNDAGSLSELGLAYLNSGQYEKADETYRKALALDPQNAALHVDYGTSILFQGKIADAMAEYRKAIEIDAKFVPAHYYLAVALSHSGDTAGGLVEYQKVVDLAGPDSTLGKKAQTAIDQAKGSSSTAGTPRVPSGTATPAAAQPTTGKVGATLTLDSAAVKVESVADWPGDDTIKPGAGKKLVQVKASVTNQGAKLLTVAADRFAVTELSGVAIAMVTGDYQGRFPTKDLAKGESASGIILFELNTDAKVLSVLYKTSNFDRNFLSFDTQ